MRLGFGCVNLGSAAGGRSSRADVRLVRSALVSGVQVFDTADAYGNGHSERILGVALQGHRDEAVVATKGGYLFRERSAPEQTGRRIVARGSRIVRDWRGRSRAGGSGHGAGGASSSYRSRDDSASHLREAVEGSLRRLRTDHIDVYQLHGPTEVHHHVFDELQDLVEAGKVGGFGIGAESVTAAVAWLDVPAVATVQVPFGVLDPEAAEELIPRLGSRPVDVWARGVLGGGLLARATRDPQEVLDDPKAAVLAQLGALARRSGLGLDALAIGFVRSFPDVSTVLLGISSQEHLDRNLTLMAAAPLPSDVADDVAAIAWSRGGADGRP